ncbi:MAG: hypothetical protein ACLR71_15705 [[Clostridium] scindens]
MGVSKKISASCTIPCFWGDHQYMDEYCHHAGRSGSVRGPGIRATIFTMTDSYWRVIGTATLASIGTAGVPSVGLVTPTHGIPLCRPSGKADRADHGH